MLDLERHLRALEHSRLLCVELCGRAELDAEALDDLRRNMAHIDGMLAHPEIVAGGGDLSPFAAAAEAARARIGGES